MHRLAFCFVLSLSLPLPLLAAGDWPQFRGPNGDGHAAGGRPPTEWDRTKNVTWRKEIPGLGWSSPVVSGGKVFLTTAVPAGRKGEYSLRVLCLDARAGDTLWDVEVFRQGPGAPAIQKKNSHASPTPVVDGEDVFVHFGHMGTACLRAKDGSTVWTQETLRYSPVHGNGGSPVLAGDKLVFNIDGADRQLVAALDRKTGKVAWRTPRDVKVPKHFSFSTPTLITVDGRPQVISAGSGVVMALDPGTGKEIWRVRYGTGYSVVPRPVYGNGLVYLSSGYDTAMLYAIRPDGAGDVTGTHVAWTAKAGAPRNASPLLVGDALVVAADDGLVTCFDAKTGKERWSERVGQAYSASPVFAGGLIYLLDEDGVATVLKPGPAFDEVATNKMGERALASPAVDGDALLLRTEKALYRIEKK
jgi:outer membrane protein assembly factor BamB